MRKRSLEVGLTAREEGRKRKKERESRPPQPALNLLNS